MTGIVQLNRQEISEDIVLSGAAISSGGTWYPAAYAANWLSAQAAVLVPGVVVDKNVIAATTGVLHFRAKTRLVSIERVWMLKLRSATEGTTATIKAPTATGTALAVTVGAERMLSPIIYREILTAQASAVTDLTIEIAAVTGDIEIDSVSCFELTRPSLNEDGTDYGIDAQTVRPRERIFEGTGYQSATGIVAASVTADPRRVGIYQWAVPVVTPITTTAAYADLQTLPSPVLARKLIVNTIVGPVWWSAYAKVSSGSGDVKLTTSQSGVSDSVNVTGTSFAWTTARSISISAEDMTTADGLVSAAFDALTVQIRANAGITFSIAGLSVWEE